MKLLALASAIIWLTAAAFLVAAALLALLATPASAHTSWCHHTGWHVHATYSVRYVKPAYVRTGHKHWVEVACSNGEKYTRTVTCERHR